jgi:hypothetical protein
MPLTSITLDDAVKPGGQEILQILRKADLIEAVDDHKGFRQTLQGHEQMARGRKPGAPPYQVEQVEIVIDSSRPEDVARAKRAVEQARR